MASYNHGNKMQEEPQAQEDFGHQQAAQERPQVSGADWKKAVCAAEGGFPSWNVIWLM